MALFRHHRGNLADSLKTTVIVKNTHDLKREILKQFDNWIVPDDPNCAVKNHHNFEVKISIPWDMPLKESFDDRCGWYQHYVTTDILKKGEFFVAGMLSEPLDEIQSKPWSDLFHMDLLEKDHSSFTIKATPELQGWDGTVTLKRKGSFLKVTFNTEFVENFEKQFHE